MLASLLPGLRDLRAPFVSGSLVLASLYLLFGQRAGQVTSGQGRTENLDDLVSWLGRPGLAAAASLAAYLIGSLVVTVSRTAIRQINERAIGRVAWRVDDRNVVRTTDGTPFDSWQAMVVEGIAYLDVLRLDARTRRGRRLFPLFPFSFDSIGSVHEEILSLVTRRQSPADERPTTLSVILKEVFRNGPRRLRLASADLHADFDRLVSEAELRDGLATSLPLATAALLANVDLSGGTESTLAAFSIALVVVLFAQARRSDREAHSLLLGAVADHIVSTRTLDAIDWKS